MNRVLVIGSANVDMIMGLSRLPKKGETVTDGVFMQTFGGKGANQAVAARRSGSEVCFLGCLGSDDHGRAIERALSADGIDTSWTVWTSEVATGSALVLYDAEGANYLAVAPGSNYMLVPADIARYVEENGAPTMIVLQYEISEEALHEAFRVAREAYVPILFNYAPARGLVKKINPGINCGIVVNESEASSLTGVQVSDAASAFEAGRELRNSGYRFSIVTLGTLGACIVSADGEVHVPAIRAVSVDSTAAGDTFCGALASALVEGKDLIRAVQFATAAASLCVERAGAQPSIPYRPEIERRLASEEDWLAFG